MNKLISSLTFFKIFLLSAVAVTPQKTDVKVNLVQMRMVGECTTTAYCGCASCCGVAGNATASGEMPKSKHTVAHETLPFGTKIKFQGDETIYTVEDRGVFGDWFDVYFDTHEEALNYGMQNRNAYIIMDD